MTTSSISLLNIANSESKQNANNYLNPENLLKVVDFIKKGPPKIITVDLTNAERDFVETNSKPKTESKMVEITPNCEPINKVLVDKVNCSKKLINTKIKPEKLGDWSLDNKNLDSNEVGEVPPLNAETKHVIRDVKLGSSGRVLIIKSKTGKAIKLMMKNSSVIQSKLATQTNVLDEDKISEKLLVPSVSNGDLVQISPLSVAKSPNVIEKVSKSSFTVATELKPPNPTKVSTNEANNIKSLNIQLISGTETKTTNITQEVLLDDTNLTQNELSIHTSSKLTQKVSTTDAKLSNIAQKVLVNSEKITNQKALTTDVKPNKAVKTIKSINTPQQIKTGLDLKPTCKKAANASATEIFPLKIPYAPTKALQISSTLQRVPEFHLIRIANGLPKQHTPVKKSCSPPIKKSLPQSPVAVTKAVKARFTKSVLKERSYVDNSTQTESVEVQHTGNQTDSVVASPARTEDLPDIKDLVKYLLGNPEYSAGLDDCKKSDLLDMSDTIMRAKMFPTPCKVVNPNSFVEKLKMQLFVDLKDCVNFDLLGNLPIHNAIVDNHNSNVKRQCFALKLRQISVNIENNERLIPLQMAILNNCDTGIIRTLLEYGGDTNAKDHEGSTIVHLSVLYSTDYNLELVLKHCPALQYIINLKNDEGVTPLILAAINSKADMVEVLLKHGADPNLRDEKSGRTALFHAVEVNSNFVINLLLKFKADPKIRNFFGLTAMDAARDLDINDTNLNPPPSPNDTVTVAKRAVAQEQNSRLERAHRTQKRLAKPKEEPAKKSRFSFKSTYRKVDTNLVNKKKK